VTSLNISFIPRLQYAFGHYIIHVGINIIHGTYEDVLEGSLKHKNASKRDFNLPFSVPIRIIITYALGYNFDA
jgi:hypothetical protein